MKSFTAILFCGALSLTLGCAASKGQTEPSVQLSGEWSSPAEYKSAYIAWTREAHIRTGDADFALDGTITLMSAPYRAAFVKAYAEAAGLSASQRRELMAEHKATYEEFWEFQMIVATHDYSWNDFSRPKRSMWHIELVDAEGNSVRPVSVKRDYRQKKVIQTWFPAFQPFYSAYVLRFPRTTEDGAAVGQERLRMRIGSALGHTEVAWGP